MLEAREMQPVDGRGGEIIAFPVASAATPRDFGRRAPPAPFSLIVDLSLEEVGPRWLRGAATFALLCSGALLLAPGFGPLVPAPVQAATLHNVDLGALAPPPVPAGTPEAADTIPLARGLLSGERDGVKRTSGDVSDGLYWSLRAAGASPELATAYLKAIATRIDVGEVAPFDRFEFVVAEASGALLYAGLTRAQGSDVELMKWSIAGRSGWFDANATQQSTSGLMAPVAGRITSGFGSRVHPILRFSRFHAGLDFGAAWGSPVVAAADGQIVGAGWYGGYGRQVRIAHGSGILTSYSHMSAIAAAPGLPVRQGQVIGYVGSSGLSTGPHLHFEVRIGGRPVNPLTAQLISRPTLDGAQRAAFKGRLKELLSIPVKPQSASSSTAA